MNNPKDASDLACLIWADWQEEFGLTDVADDIRQSVTTPTSNNWVFESGYGLGGVGGFGGVGGGGVGGGVYLRGVGSVGGGGGVVGGAVGLDGLGGVGGGVGSYGGGVGGDVATEEE